MPRNCVNGNYCYEEQCGNTGLCRRTDPEMRASEIERELVRVRLRLERALKESLKYIPDTDRSGHPHGYSVVQIPDWETRQTIDAINEALGVSRG